MPVRSLNSAVLKWPGREEVDQAARRWARRVARNCDRILRVGYFGSYATGDWGVGSDLDLIVLVESSDRAFERRSVDFIPDDIPVPCEVLVYTREEWERMKAEGAKFARTVEEEAVWIFNRPAPSE